MHWSTGEQIFMRREDRFVMVAGAMLGPIYALFVKNIGGNLLDASCAAAVFFLTGGIVMLISGKYNAMFVVMGLLCFASAAYVFMLPRSVL